MPSFSKRSLANLATCHGLLQLVGREAIKSVDFAVVYGRRTVAEQLELMREGKSRVKNPRSSYHVADPPDLADAFDAAPYVPGVGLIAGRNERELRYFYYMIGQIKRTAFDLEVPLISGGDWDNDGDFSDQSFHDLYHFQLDRAACRERGIYEGDGLAEFLKQRGFALTAGR